MAPSADGRSLVLLAQLWPADLDPWQDTARQQQCEDGGIAMMPGMPDLGALLQQAQQMQADMAAAQSDLALTEVTGHAGGGLVTATVTGDGQLKALVIDPSVVDPNDVDTLADLVVAAVRDASRAAAEIAEQTMGAVAGELTGPGGLQAPGGFDLSAFGLPALDDFIDEDDELDDDEDDSDEDDDDELDDNGPRSLTAPPAPEA